MALNRGLFVRFLLARFQLGPSASCNDSVCSSASPRQVFTRQLCVSHNSHTGIRYLALAHQSFQQLSVVLLHIICGIVLLPPHMRKVIYGIIGQIAVPCVHLYTRALGLRPRPTTAIIQSSAASPLQLCTHVQTHKHTLCQTPASLQVIKPMREYGLKHGVH